MLTTTPPPSRHFSHKVLLLFCFLIMSLPKYFPLLVLLFNIDWNDKIIAFQCLCPMARFELWTSGKDSHQSTFKAAATTAHFFG